MAEIVATRTSLHFDDEFKAVMVARSWVPSIDTPSSRTILLDLDLIFHLIHQR